MSTHTDHLTADELLHMPDDGLRRELIAGELREMTPSGHEHGDVAMRLAGPLSVFIVDHQLGAAYAAETGFLLGRNPDTVRAPDFAFVSRERLAAVAPGRGYFPGPPDLAVEVLLPGDVAAEVEAKIQAWLEAGCRMVVAVNTRHRTVKVYRGAAPATVLTEDDEFDGGDVVPGFHLAVWRIFPEAGTLVR